MPKFASDSGSLQKFNAGHFGFSAASPDELEAQEYTLVVVASDRSTSTSGFQNEMEACVKEIVGACQKSPRADNLMIRFLAFDDDHEEVHGYKLLGNIVVDDYDGTLAPQGMTACHDTVIDGLESIENYGEQLSESDFDCNAILFVTTDGMDNRSTFEPHHIAERRKKILQGEHVQGLITVLVGVNITEPEVSRCLKQLEAEGEFDRYIELKDASRDTLAKLANFVSTSVSSHSQALSQGLKSTNITSINF